MKSSVLPSRWGFTLVEIMIVIAIITLLAAIAVPNVMRARKRAQATRIYNDLRILDYAVDRWALEKNKSIGDVAEFSDLAPYLKEGQLTATGADLFNQPLGPFTVDAMPRVSAVAFSALSDVAPAQFWSPFN